MVRTVLTGATGTLGQALRPRLLDAGHEVRATSRSPPTDGDVEWVEMDLSDGTGIAEAVTDVDVVVHTATAPQGDSETVDVQGTRRLLDAADDAGVSNVLYVSIVGIDEIPFSYYQHKLAAEAAIESSEVPSTILRSTQFHQFLDDILGSVSRLPVWPLPTRMQLQPIDVGEAADAVVEHVTPRPQGRVPDIGGPDVHTLGEIATAYRRARGLRRPIIRFPIPGAVASAFRAGKAICPDRDVGTVPWAEWVDGQYGSDTTTATTSSASPS